MQLSAVDLNLIVALDALLQERSVARAAQRVGLSSSAMSHALARLRDVLDDPILTRSGRGMVPTARAEALTDQVRRAVLEAEKVFAVRRRFDPTGLRRAFRIGASDLATVVLGPALEHLLLTEAPGVAVRYVPIDDPAEALRDGDCDLVLGTMRDLPRDIRSAVLFEDGWVCVVRGDTPGAGERFKLEQLVELPHIDVLAEGGDSGGLDEALARYGKQRRVARAVPYYLGALHLVSRTDYVTTVPSCLARTVQRFLRLRVLVPPVPLDPVVVGLAWHVGSDADPEQRWFREMVERAVDLSV